MLAQILRPKGRQLGLDLSPVTDRPELIQALSEFLTIAVPPSAGQVIALDLQTVGVDLSAVPIDEVLSFRSSNLDSHRAYIRAVRRFVRELSVMPEESRRLAMLDRGRELDDMASDLTRNARKAWRRAAAFALSIAGATWKMASGDPLGALLGAGAALAGGVGGTGAETGAYSYLFAAHERYA